MTQLWEAQHPYYAQEGNFYSRGCHSIFHSWEEFKEDALYKGDRDLNLLYRWDWKNDQLKLFYVFQRKAICCSALVRVQKNDEPAIRAYLECCARKLADLWKPLSL